ncbi:transposase [Pseudoglutamicibacter cumminsii]|uniref:transposase n=2 Tax=Actinomycetota TaxID=201174 RepID=UPI0019562B27
MPRKYSDEFKAKAVRLAEEFVELEGCSKWGAAVEIGDKVGVSAHTLNNWLKPSGPSHGVEGSSGELADDELKRLRRENKELRRANEMADSTGQRNGCCEMKQTLISGGIGCRASMVISVVSRSSSRSVSTRRDGDSSTSLARSGARR